MKRSIPELRDALLRVAGKLAVIDHENIALEIIGIVDEMVRSSPVRRAKVKHRPLTEEEKERVKELVRSNPTAHLSEIAALFNVNPGRISEALRS